jgi:tetratricopeptide (TPR) repeat protein
MGRVQGRCGWIKGLLWLCISGPLAADTLSQLPATWSERIEPLAEADISALDQNERRAVTEARDRVAELLQADATDAQTLAEAFGRLCALYQRLDVYAPAQGCWRNAMALEPENFRWTYYAGYLALEQGQYDTALPLLEKARRLNADYAPIELRLGQIWLNTNDLDKAHAALARAAETSGLRGAALYYRGQAALLQRDYASAERYLTESLEIDPEATEVHYPLAQVYRHQGKEALAREHLALFKGRRKPVVDDPLVTELDEAVQIARTAFRDGIKAVRARDYALAIERFEAGLESDPENLAARVSYARALFLDGQVDAARSQLQSVIARDPKQLLANLLLGLLDESRGEAGEAAARYRRVLALDANHDAAHFFLANLLFRQGRYEQAAQHYASALKVNDAIPPARLLELVALRRAGHDDVEIAGLLEQRIGRYPNQPDLKYALALLRILSPATAVRDNAQALELAESLMAAQPMPPFVETLALAKAAAGRFDEAVQVQQQLVDRMTWMAPQEQMRPLREALDAFNDEKLPMREAWPADAPLLNPSPFDATPPFRDYPAPVPF